jgi:hypothetical protein
VETSYFVCGMPFGGPSMVFGFEFFPIKIPAAVTNLIAYYPKAQDWQISQHLEPLIGSGKSLNACLPIAMLIHTPFEPFQGRIRISLTCTRFQFTLVTLNTDPLESNTITVVIGEDI